MASMDGGMKNDLIYAVSDLQHKYSTENPVHTQVHIPAIAQQKALITITFYRECKNTKANIFLLFFSKLAVLLQEMLSHIHLRSFLTCIQHVCSTQYCTVPVQQEICTSEISYTLVHTSGVTVSPPNITFFQLLLLLLRVHTEVCTRTQLAPSLTRRQ